jgi:hypothetical protein
MTAGIGTLNEKPLHAALKEFYARPGDRTEVRLDRWVVDILHDNGLIEIQTHNLGAIRRKLLDLCQRYPVRLVYPVAQEKWIVRLAQDGTRVVGRRKSPKQGSPELVFDELVSMPRLLLDPNFTLEVVMIQEEEVRHPDSTVNWRRRGWAVSERRLLQVVDRHVYQTPTDFYEMIPATLPEPFTARQLALALGQPLRLGQRMAYCLREMEVLDVTGTHQRSYLYARKLRP